MGVTTRGYPYPEPTAPIGQGADNIKALAEAVTVRLGTAYAATVSVAVDNAASASTAVTFPAGRFTFAPKLAAQAVGTTTWLATVANSTATGCSVTLFTRAGTAGSTSGVSVFLLAMQ
jgi:hypothetical protein